MPNDLGGDSSSAKTNAGESADVKLTGIDAPTCQNGVAPRSVSLLSSLAGSGCLLPTIRSCDSFSWFFLKNVLYPRRGYSPFALKPTKGGMGDGAYGENPPTPSSLPFDSSRVEGGVPARFSGVLGIVCVHSGVWNSTDGPRLPRRTGTSLSHFGLNIVFAFDSFFWSKTWKITRFFLSSFIVLLLPCLFLGIRPHGWRLEWRKWTGEGWRGGTAHQINTPNSESVLQCYFNLSISFSDMHKKQKKENETRTERRDERAGLCLPSFSFSRRATFFTGHMTLQPIYGRITADQGLFCLYVGMDDLSSFWPRLLQSSAPYRPRMIAHCCRHIGHFFTRHHWILIEKSKNRGFSIFLSYQRIISGL